MQKRKAGQPHKGWKAAAKERHRQMSDKPDILSVVHNKQRKILKAFIREYGDDSNRILNALHEMSARVALFAGVEPDTFAAGVKHHWDFIANAVNGDAGSPSHPQ